MISAVVLTPDTWRGDDVGREREIVARSLVWLVSAVVVGTVRDVTLAVPAGLGLSALADQSGCALVQDELEADRLREAAALCREPRVLILRAAYQPGAGFIEEIDAFARRESETAAGVLQAVPSTLVQRLVPWTAPVVGALVRRDDMMVGGFDRLARSARRRGVRFEARARPIR